jgi:hypothetical protein
LDAVRNSAVPAASDGTSRRPAVGTLRWARQTDGILQSRDRWVLLGQALRYGLASVAGNALRLLGTRGRPVPVDPAMLEPPDSRASREAEQRLAETTPAMVANHSRRSYAWAAALAARDGLAYDKEIVYVASLLHDLYLARPGEPGRPHCFTLPAADGTLSVARGCGWTEQRATVAAEAITLHANVWPPRQTIESYLVFAGSRLDVVGYRYRDLHPSTVGAVLDRYPRLNLTQESVALFAAQARANPRSRLAFLAGLPGAEWFMRRGPFDE